MPKRCKHLGAQILEFGTAVTVHNRDPKYGTWSHFSDTEEYTGMIEVSCDECGYLRRGRWHTMPQWAQRMIDEATEASRPAASY